MEPFFTDTTSVYIGQQTQPFNYGASAAIQVNNLAYKQFLKYESQQHNATVKAFNDAMFTPGTMKPEAVKKAVDTYLRGVK